MRVKVDFSISENTCALKEKFHIHRRGEDTNRKEKGLNRHLMLSLSSLGLGL
jgi:hypothetical protein